jgi:flagellar basal body-associated protein FliL
MASEGGNNAAMAVLVVALIAVVGIFVYFMSTNQQPNTVIQTPAPTIEAPKVSMPEPAGSPAQ